MLKVESDMKDLGPKVWATRRRNMIVRREVFHLLDRLGSNLHFDLRPRGIFITLSVSPRRETGTSVHSRIEEGRLEMLLHAGCRCKIQRLIPHAKWKDKENSGFCCVEMHDVL